MSSNTHIGKMPLGTEGTPRTKRIIHVYKCSYEFLSLIFVMKVPCSHTSPGPWKWLCFTTLCALTKILSASWYFFLHAKRQQAGMNQTSPLFAPSSCLCGSISSDLIAYDWDLITYGKWAPGRLIQLLSGSSPLGCSVPVRAEPCSSHRLIPPHALNAAAAGAGQGAKTPSSPFFQMDQSGFRPYNSLLSVAPLWFWSSSKCSIRSTFP